MENIGVQDTEREDWWLDDHAAFDIENIVKAPGTNNDVTAIEQLRSSLVKSKKKIG